MGEHGVQTMLSSSSQVMFSKGNHPLHLEHCSHWTPCASSIVTTSISQGILPLLLPSVQGSAGCRETSWTDQSSRATPANTHAPALRFHQQGYIFGVPGSTVSNPARAATG